jgi:hypothetical protein
VAVVVEHLIAGILLGLAFACVVLPALCALAGPDEEEQKVRRVKRPARVEVSR